MEVEQSNSPVCRGSFRNCSATTQCTQQELKLLKAKSVPERRRNSETSRLESMRPKFTNQKRRQQPSSHAQLRLRRTLVLAACMSEVTPGAMAPTSQRTHVAPQGEDRYVAGCPMAHPKAYRLFQELDRCRYANVLCLVRTVARASSLSMRQ
jgi:hypothetical protein